MLVMISASLLLALLLVLLQSPLSLVIITTINVGNDQYHFYYQLTTT